MSCETIEAASVGGLFTLRQPKCAYGLIAQLVQRSARAERAPTASPGRGSFYMCWRTRSEAVFGLAESAK